MMPWRAAVGVAGVILLTAAISAGQPELLNAVNEPGSNWRVARMRVQRKLCARGFCGRMHLCFSD
jgi:hypothetical protein